MRLLSAAGEPLARHELRRAGFLWGLAPVASPEGSREWLVGGERGRVHRLVLDGGRFHEAARTPVRGPLRSLAVHAKDGTWVGMQDGSLSELGSEGAADAHRGPVTALALLGDGRLVSGGEDGRVLLWDLDGLRRGGHVRPKLLAQRGDFITRLVPSPSGLLCAGYDGLVTAIDPCAVATF